MVERAGGAKTTIDDNPPAFDEKGRPFCHRCQQYHDDEIDATQETSMDKDDWIEFQIGFEPFEYVSVRRDEVQAVMGDEPEVWLLLRDKRSVQIKGTRDQAIARLTR